MPDRASIGVYTPQVPSTESIPRRVTPTLSGVSEGDALTQLGSSWEQSQKIDGVVQANAAMADARLKWTQQLQQRQQSYQPGDNFTGQLAADFNKDHQDTKANLSNPYAQGAFDKQMTAFGAEVGEKASAFQAKAEQDGRVHTYLDSTDKSGVTVQTDPTQFGVALGSQLHTLQALNIDPETKDKLFEHTKSTLAMAASKSLAENQPYNTLLSLTKADTGNDALNALTAAQRLEVRDHVITTQRTLQSEQEHELVMNDKRQRDASNALSKQGDDLLASGKLTPEWLHSHEKTFEPNEYRYFTRALSGADAETDPQTYADLLGRAQKGDDVSDDARTALLAGRLKKEDYAKITTDVAQERPGWYKRGSSYLNDSLAVSQLNPDPAAQRSRANALADWQEWSQKNPKATDIQARQQSELLASHYQLIPQDKVTLGMRAPMFLVGTRLKPDLDATGKATADAYKSGAISREEAAREALLLQSYRRIEAAKNAPKPKAAP